ncbi:MAG: TIGR04211 family SH3 domain-containing protein [Gammaproteobacteria bacterium]|nr:TIGR04211 family SH3 domain-containing protein [Gammaproteobacteria bacterium]
MIATTTLSITRLSQNSVFHKFVFHKIVLLFLLTFIATTLSAAATGSDNKEKPPATESAPDTTRYLYVPEIVAVELRSAPEKKAKTVQVMTTGDRLILLAEKKGYYQVEHASGKKGWVAKEKLQSEPTARFQLADMQRQLEEIKFAEQSAESRCERRIAATMEGGEVACDLKLDDTDNEQTQNSEMLAVLEQTNLELEKQIYEYQQQIESLQSPPPVSRTPEPICDNHWSDRFTLTEQTGIVMAIVILLLLIGSIHGRHQLRKKITRRFGGLDL